MPHPNETLVRSFFAAFETGDLGALTALFTDDVVFHEPGDHALAGDHRGRDAVMDFFRALGGVGGGTLRVDEVRDIIGGDTHVVALMSTSAERDGQRIRADVAEVYQIRDGRICDIRAHVYDQDAWNAAFT